MPWRTGGGQRAAWGWLSFSHHLGPGTELRLESGHLYLLSHLTVPKALFLTAFLVLYSKIFNFFYNFIHTYIRYILTVSISTYPDSS